MRLKNAIIDHGVDIGNQKMMVGLTNVEYKLRVLSIHSWHVCQSISIKPPWMFTLKIEMGSGQVEACRSHI